MPLSFVIARYFAYAFAAVATAWLASFMVLSVAINAGFVYEASWGPANVREVAEGLARDGVCGQQDVPTAYRYLILNKDGYVLMTDLEGTRLEDATEMARAALAADPGTVEIEGGGSGLTYAAFPLKGGGACALVSEYLPQWVSRDLAQDGAARAWRSPATSRADTSSSRCPTTDRASLPPPSNAAVSASSQTTPPAPRATEDATTGSASTPPPRPRAPTGAPSRSPTAPRAARWPPSRSPCAGSDDSGPHTGVPRNQTLPG